ncbi:BsuPI-related putative proteinase inhibitor [Cohnella caldifontis]|uniref:BsuPI-related putative proteinase inhibitor n=1 Tax=Cohnella caldifontis TaxID=3027471 RepID=UPI0023EDA3A5|nr:BsuPI-related putative proteinase inhibitor [Cohnella sp. YIM B05605]
MAKPYRMAWALLVVPLVLAGCQLPAAADQAREEWADPPPAASAATEPAPAAAIPARKLDADSIRLPAKRKEIPTMAGLFETAVDAKMEDGKLKLRISVSNVSGKSVQVRYGGQRYDFRIFDQEGNEIYTWSDNKAFIAVVTDAEMRPSETASYREEWDLLDRQGNRVPPGEYTVRGNLMAELREGVPEPSELAGEATVEIE